MKPKTKKTLIIIVAVAVVAAIVYFAFIRNSSKNLIDRLNIDAGIKKLLRDKAEEVEKYAAANPGDATSNDWSKQGLLNKAKSNGRTYEQQVVIEAAYNLYTLGHLDAAQYALVEAEINATK